MTNTIDWSDFEKIDMRVGTIISAIDLKKAKQAAFVLQIDFGDLGIKTSSAQITIHYQKGEIVGKQIIAIVNFPPKRIAGIKSECLVMGIYDKDNEVVLLSADKQVKNGLKIG